MIPPEPPAIDLNDLYRIIGHLYVSNVALQQQISETRAAMEAHQCGESKQGVEREIEGN